jgi:hypothetical protein
VAGEYYIEWILEIEEEVTNAVFAPVKRTFFSVTKPESETITIEPVNLVPRGGVSMPLTVTLSRG